MPYRVKLLLKNPSSETEYVAPTHREGTIASYNALPLEQNRMRFYLLTIPVHDIFPYAFIVRRQEDPIAGFQRLLNHSRAVDIAYYLDRSKGSIPTNIVVSAQPDARLTYDSRTKTLKYRRVPGSFLVLDGQHRLFGYGMTTKPHRVPVAIYENLSRRDEVRLFIDINTNQKSVPAALLLDIKQLAETETAMETRLRELFDALNTSPDSALNGLLSASASISGKLSRVAFQRSMTPVLENSVVRSLPPEQQYKLVKHYFNALESALAKPNLLGRAVYFDGFCQLFEEVLNASVTRYGNCKQSSLEQVVAPLAGVDLTQISTEGGTKLTRTRVASILKQVLATKPRVTEDML